MNRKLALWATATIVAGGVVSACSSGPAASVAPTASPSPSTTNVGITLSEWAIANSVSTAPAGEVKFTVSNQGPADVHEFVVIKTNLSLTSLPVDSMGKVNEEGPGMEPIDEIEDLAVGGTQDLVVNLEPGSYVLICNIYDEVTHESHYQMGMRNSFTVTP
jgi:uncharacterized cupredoxin-like copper-binding protein